MPKPPPARLLIVDDETAQMKALCDTLEDRGFVTTGFASARAALASLDTAKYDLLLTDLTMPEMDGITLLQGALEKDPELVGIIMTGDGTIATAVEAMKSGALDYILKPFKVSVVLPVLSRALAMRQLRLDNAELEKQVAQRTEELEVANRELEAFAYSVSHDLRAPLRHIDGYAGMLQLNYGAQMPDEAQRLLSVVTTSAKRMGQLIEDLLRLSRLGRQTLTRRPVDMIQMVKEVLAELDKDRGDRSIEIQIGELPGCLADDSLLRQVWVNLLANAFKFTRQIKPAVIEIGCRPDQGDNIYFVRDNGAGFNMQYADKLFGVFQRLHRAEDFEGTGVGLSIVARIIQRHGGRIWAEGEVGKGAVFYFTVPDPAQPVRLSPDGSGG